jgi:AcrR family transcriptional regulator
MSEATGTRDRLLEVAIAMVEERGEAGLRVDEVASLAGFTKPVVYHYFGDREGLVIAVQAERYRRSLQYGLSNLAEEALRCDSADEFVDLVHRWLRSFFSPEGAMRRAFRIDVLGSGVSRAELRAVVNQTNLMQAEGVAGLARLAQARGWMPARFDPVAVGIWFTGLLLSRYLVEMGPGTFDEAAWDDITLQAARFVITGEGLPPPV